MFSHPIQFIIQLKLSKLGNFNYEVVMFYFDFSQLLYMYKIEHFSTISCKIFHSEYLHCMITRVTF